MKKKGLIIFDVDGTLFDTSEGMITSVQYTIKKCGLRELTKKELLSFVGPGIEDSLIRIYGISGFDLRHAAGIFRERYGSGDVLKAHPYEGVNDVLIALSGKYDFAIATNKRRTFTNTLLKQWNIEDYFITIQAPDQDEKACKKRMIKRCMEATGFSGAQSIMIGDTYEDLYASYECEAKFVGVTYGYGFRENDEITMSDKSMFIDDIRKLPEVIKG